MIGPKSSFSSSSSFVVELASHNNFPYRIGLIYNSNFCVIPSGHPNTLTRPKDTQYHTHLSILQKKTLTACIKNAFMGINGYLLTRFVCGKGVF